ncbi:MAG TPA: UbiA family prenyltransferase [Casimicrobiaceae bacterium]|nr:UbiA family prenyltransferase [Casimicrobiaceae bacterium]
MQGVSGAARPVLCVDLDGTLVRTDTLMESLLVLVRHRPWIVLALPWWMLRGRASFKARIASLAPIDAATLPYDPDVVAFLRSEHAAGRTIVLATASHIDSARRIAEHLELFAGVHATDRVNCKSVEKANVLALAYGEGGFTYAGDSRADIAVWKRARAAILVNASPRVRDALGNVPIEREFPRRASRAAELWRLLRPHQWAKNALLAVPLLTAHKYADSHAVVAAALAVLAMCATASAIYVVNDLLDLEADRRHPVKHRRPFASGTVPLQWAIPVIAVLATASAFACVPLPRAFSLGLASYAVAAVGYSLWVKHVAWLDAGWLACLYTLRIYLGALAIEVPISGWLLAFSFFAFGSLALMKRFTELTSLAYRHGVHHARAYHFDDRKFVEVVGWGSSLLAVAVLVLYLGSETAGTLYRDPHLLWGAVPLIAYLLLASWWAAHEGRMHEDPVWYVIRKPGTYIVLGAVLGLMLAAR